MRKMKKGVVAQLIYMLVLIAIAVVVGLFFMTVVEKNKKNTTEQAYSEISFEALKLGDKLDILASTNPKDKVNDLYIYCRDSAGNKYVVDSSLSFTDNISKKYDVKGDFYTAGAGYKIEVTNAKNCARVTIKDETNNVVYLNKVLE